jgi:hypothetical protein
MIAVQSILKIAAALPAGDMEKMEFWFAAEKRGEHLLGEVKTFRLATIAAKLAYCKIRTKLQYPINVAAPSMLLPHQCYCPINVTAPSMLLPHQCCRPHPPPSMSLLAHYVNYTYGIYIYKLKPPRYTKLASCSTTQDRIFRLQWFHLEDPGPSRSFYSAAFYACVCMLHLYPHSPNTCIWDAKESLLLSRHRMLHRVVSSLSAASKMKTANILIHQTVRYLST